MQHGPGGYNGLVQGFDAKAFERMGLELFEQAFGGIGLVKYP